MASLREIQKRDTRRRLYESALERFRERGYEDVTVDEIVQAAGTAKGTFFNHFPTKDHVLAAYHKEMTGWVVDQVRDETFASCEDAVLTYASRFADWGTRDPRLVALCIRRIFASPVMWEADQQNWRDSITWMQDRIAEGMRSGELKPDLDVPTLMAMIAAVFSFTGNAWALAGGFDGRAALERRLRFVFDAARSRPRSTDEDPSGDPAPHPAG